MVLPADQSTYKDVRTSVAASNILGIQTVRFLNFHNLHFHPSSSAAAVGRIIWMLPPPDQSSSEDAHVPVTNPDKAQHPEDHPSSSSGSALPSTAAAASASAGNHSAAAPASAGSHAVTGTSAEEEVQQLWQAQPILLDVQKECFSRLLLLPEILVDHLPDTYLAAVQQL